MRRLRRVRAGWSKTPLPITPEMRVLDVGSGAYPNRRSDVLCDRELDDTPHRSGASLVIDRPLVCGDVTALPFRDGAFDFVLATHIAEHVEDPARFCAELARVAPAGYIETPSPIADVLLQEEVHIWRVSRGNGGIRFAWKEDRPRWLAAIGDRFQRLYNSPQPRCNNAAYRLPAGPIGQVLRLLIRGVGGILNVSGIMHTRVLFRPGRPLRYTVDRPVPLGPARNRRNYDRRP